MLNKVSASFFMPFVSFIVITIFGYRTYTSITLEINKRPIQRRLARWL